MRCNSSQPLWTSLSALASVPLCRPASSHDSSRSRPNPGSLQRQRAALSVRGAMCLPHHREHRRARRRRRCLLSSLPVSVELGSHVGACGECRIDMELPVSAFADPVTLISQEPNITPRRKVTRSAVADPTDRHEGRRNSGMSQARARRHVLQHMIPRSRNSRNSDQEIADPT